MKTNIDRNVAPFGCKQKGCSLREHPCLCASPAERDAIIRNARFLVEWGVMKGWIKRPVALGVRHPVESRRAEP
jgi:hypothetical protein